MADTQTLPPRGALAEGLSQGLDALLHIRHLAGHLGDETTVTTAHVLAVRSAAEVDGFAAETGVKPEWSDCRTYYRATWTGGTATVTVSFTSADAAAAEVPGSAA
jgi:hypothetical protein